MPQRRLSAPPTRESLEERSCFVPSVSRVQREPFASRDPFGLRRSSLLPGFQGKTSWMIVPFLARFAALPEKTLLPIFSVFLNSGSNSLMCLSKTPVLPATVTVLSRIHQGVRWHLHTGLDDFSCRCTKNTRPGHRFSPRSERTTLQRVI